MMNRSKASYIKKKKKGYACFVWSESLFTRSLFLVQTLIEVLACQLSLKKGIGIGPNAGCPCAWMCAADPGEAECFCLPFGSVEV